jgi:protein gp37
MGEQTKIAWCDHTFNPWIGCSKVSSGCANCYAEKLMDTRYGRVQWGVNGTRVRTSESNWKQPYKWNRKAMNEGVRRRVFCASLADVFEDRDELWQWRNDLWEMIENTPYLDWLLLTKRPKNILCTMPAHWFTNLGHLSNVSFGFSAEDQDHFEERWQEMKYVARYGYPVFVSAEPLLGPIDLDPWKGADNYLHLGQRGWVIVGGESGVNARPMHPDWARGIRDQCRAAGVPFFFKQWGEWLHQSQGASAKYSASMKIHKWSEYPFDWSRCVGKGAAGHLLDNREWHEFPL